MGSKKSWHLNWVMLFLLHVSSIVQGKNESCNPVLLDDFIHDYAFKQVPTPRTKQLQKISLPSIFSGMEVSFIRLRSHGFYLHGANYSSFHIPPSIICRPFVQRIDLYYQNLGNWSSCYYNVANYTLVTPVVALMVYDATSFKVGKSLTFDFSANGDPILVHFPQVSIPNKTAKCVRFDINGTVEITNVTSSNGCSARSQGHFAIVVPTPTPPPTLPPMLPPTLPPMPPPESEMRERRWKRWVIGFGAGIGGLILAIVLGFLVYKMVKRRRMGKMERESERSEALDTMWVGRSRMPSATGIRTQPVIENEYVP